MNQRRRQLAALAALSSLGLALLAGCATTPSPTTLTATVAAAPQLQSLSKLIADTGLSETLSGTGPFTLLAPSDEAFKALPPKTQADLAADKNLLKSVLSYHVLPGKLTAADIKNGNIKSVQGANVALARAGNFVTVEEAVVTQADLIATNGVVHIIDKVLMPPKR
jgi:uncharacterized surface protein with fasciclin (FAS1) repeats